MSAIILTIIIELRERAEELIKSYNKGLITYSEYLHANATLHDNAKNEIFDFCWQNASEWEAEKRSKE